MDVIDRHIRMAKSAGIDGFIVSSSIGGASCATLSRVAERTALEDALLQSTDYDLLALGEIVRQAIYDRIERDNTFIIAPTCPAVFCISTRSFLASRSFTLLLITRGVLAYAYGTTVGSWPRFVGSGRDRKA